MGSVTVVQNNFNGGELSPLMGARTDQARYSNGCRTLKNMVVFPHGPATRRPGLQYLGRCASDEGAIRLIPFVFNVEQACVLELSHKTMRVWMNGGLVLNDSDTPYSVATPWDGDELPELSFCQSADVLFIVCPTKPPYKLCRYGNTDWRIELMEVGCSVAAPSGLAASKSGATERNYSYVVTAVDQFSLEESPPSSPVTIRAAKTISVSAPVTLTWNAVAGDVVYAVYKCWNDSGKYGFVGKATNNKWVDRGVTPDFSEGHPITRNPFTGDGNYPGAVQFYQQRLCFGGTKKNPQTVWTSRSGNYSNFNVSDPLRDDDSVVATIAAERVNGISWMVPARQLLIGTAGSEWSMGGINGQPLSPSSIQFQRESVNGAAATLPLVVGESVLFLQYGGKVIREMQYSLQKDGYTTTDLSILSEHMLSGSPVVSWAYQQAPYSIVWCVLADGSLVACTYERDHDVIGWHKHESDGFFEYVCTISGDELWCVVKRTVAGEQRRYMERLSPFSSAEEVEKQFFVDSGISYAGAPRTDFSGLDHLEGKEVHILADGYVAPPAVVTQGRITLSEPASTVHAGLPYVSEMSPLEPEIVLQDGSTKGKTRRANRVNLQLHKSGAFEIGTSGSRLEEILPVAIDSLDEPPSLFSGDVTAELNSGFTSGIGLTLMQKSPLPFTLLSYAMQVEIGER